MKHNSLFPAAFTEKTCNSQFWGLWFYSFKFKLVPEEAEFENTQESGNLNFRLQLELSHQHKTRFQKNTHFHRFLTLSSHFFVPFIPSILPAYARFHSFSFWQKFMCNFCWKIHPPLFSLFQTTQIKFW